MLLDPFTARTSTPPDRVNRRVSLRSSVKHDAQRSGGTKSGNAQNWARESPRQSVLCGTKVDADVVTPPSQAMAVLTRVALNVVSASRDTWAIHPMSYRYRSRNRTFFKYTSRDPSTLQFEKFLRAAQLCPCTSPLCCGIEQPSWDLQSPDSRAQRMECTI